MKYVAVILGGAADLPAEELGGKTPLEAAKIPNLHYFTKIGKLGFAKMMPERLDPLPDAALMNFLGYEADKVYTGRGPIEAANLDLKLEDNEIPFRVNFITEADGRLADPTAGGLSTKEAKALINFLNKKLASGFVRFFPESEYRHVAVLKDAHGYDALSAKTTAPETIVGEKMENHFPRGAGEELLKKLMFDARLLLQDHEINQVRVDLGENPANMIWLWGQGRLPVLEKFRDKYGLAAALIARMEYPKGIGRLTGMTVVELPEKTPDTEAVYDRKAKAVLETLEDKDFVCCHVNACDEASLAGDLKGKISTLEAVDFYLLSRLREYFEKNKEYRILVTPLYAVPWKLRRHVRDAVPFVTAGKNVMPDEAEKFSELAAKSTDFKPAKAHELLGYLFGK